jgi:parallel beta-helix repeat protein
MLTLVLMGALALALEIPQVKATGFEVTGLQYIYIMSNGTVVPSDAPIQRDGNNYTLINDTKLGWGIVIQKDGITFDGASYTLQGLSDRIGVGISLCSRSNVMIKNVKIRRFQVGIQLDSCNNCELYRNRIFDGKETDSVSTGIYLLNSNHNTLFDNKVLKVARYKAYHRGIVLDGSSYNRIFNCTAIYNGDADNGWGICLTNSTCNDVFDNEASSNHDGIGLSSNSSNNSIRYNTVYNNGVTAGSGEGIGLYNSRYNTIKNNNIKQNNLQVVIVESYNNSWDGGYPSYSSGGNCWSNYTGTDTDGDGIGDTPHIIDANNKDNYPLMKYNYTYLYLTIEAGSGGTTDPVPETYPCPYPGMNVTVTATPTEGYNFIYWILDGSMWLCDNPTTITMNSNHTLQPLFSSGGGGSDVPCPTLFAWNGTDYVDLGVIGIHGQEDVVNETFVAKGNVGVDNYKAKFRLREGWPCLNYSHSEIDQVKLYAIINGERWLCPLINAIHSELGNVYLQLLLSDDYRTDMYLLETIDVQFIVPYQTNKIQSYIFVIEGHNRFKL